MKIEDLLNHEKALQSLNTIQLRDAQKAWDISEAMDEVKKHLKRFHEKRDELLKKFGTPEDESETSYTIPKGNLKAFNEELAQLMAVQAKVSFPRIKLSDLNGAVISPNDISGLRELKILLK